MRVPRWLVLLLTGAALGIGGMIFVQERYLPPRISVEAGEHLRHSLETSEAERQRQESALGETSRRLQASLNDRKGLAEELAGSRAAADRLQQDLKAIVSTLPPDPRDGIVEVRAGRFVATGATLNYSVVLTRGHGGEAPMAASMQFVVEGDSARGTATEFTSPPQAVSLAPFQIESGSIALPDGMKPRQAKIRILDRGGSKSLGMRVLEVK
jgi:hypothetical protein